MCVYKGYQVSLVNSKNYKANLFDPLVKDNFATLHKVIPLEMISKAYSMKMNNLVVSL